MWQCTNNLLSLILNSFTCYIGVEIPTLVLWWELDERISEMYPCRVGTQLMPFTVVISTHQPSHHQVLFNQQNSQGTQGRKPQLCLLFFKFSFIWKRAITSSGEGQREREREADSPLRRKPDSAGSIPGLELMTWAESRHPTDWATQAPQETTTLMGSSSFPFISRLTFPTYLPIWLILQLGLLNECSGHTPSNFTQFFAKIIKYASRTKGNKKEQTISQCPRCIKGKGALSRHGMSDVLEHRGYIRVGFYIDWLQIIPLLEDIILAIVLLHVRAKVVQDVLFQLTPHFTCACDICGVRRREAQVLGRLDQHIHPLPGKQAPVNWKGQPFPNAFFFFFLMCLKWYWVYFFNIHTEKFTHDWVSTNWRAHATSCRTRRQTGLGALTPSPLPRSHCPN